MRCAQIEDGPYNAVISTMWHSLRALPTGQQLVADVSDMTASSQALAEKVQRLDLWSQRHRAIRQSLTHDGATIHMFPELGEQLSAEEMLRRETTEFARDFPIDTPGARIRPALDGVQISRQERRSSSFDDRRKACRLKTTTRSLKQKIYALMAFALFHQTTPRFAQMAAGSVFETE